MMSKKRCDNNGKCAYNGIIPFVFFDPGKANVDLDQTMGVLFFNSVQRESGIIPQSRSHE